MPLIRCAMIGLAALAAMAGTCGTAWAFGAGGTAPGGPLSGSIRPACNGYNMDGTIDNSPGADRPGCVDTSVRSIHRPHPDAPRDR